MPALNFQKRFVRLVESGEKRQTIRAYRRDGRDPKPGDTLYLFTGMRTKRCRRLREVECVARFRIFIDHHDLQIDNRRCGASEADDIAKMDGFENWPELVAAIEKMHGVPFDGLMFRW